MLPWLPDGEKGGRLQPQENTVWLLQGVPKRVTKSHLRLGVSSQHSEVRTEIESTYALFKKNRSIGETSNTYVGLDSVLMHVIADDIVLTQDIIYDYLHNGQVSPIIKA